MPRPADFSLLTTLIGTEAVRAGDAARDWWTSHLELMNQCALHG
jgi:hypothetical protein